MSFDNKGFLAALERLAHEREDHRDPRALAGLTCRYQINGEPSCIVGCALVEVGVTVEQLAEFDARKLSGAKGVLESLGASRKVANFADMVQHFQDGKRAWGQAWQGAIDDMGLPHV